MNRLDFPTRAVHVRPPSQEIRDRYPPWLEVHQGTLPAEDYRRYVAQYESVQRVCSHYETSPSDFSTLMDLIQEVRDCVNIVRMTTVNCK